MKVFSRFRLVLILTASLVVGSGASKAQSSDPVIQSALRLIELGEPARAVEELKHVNMTKNADAHAVLAMALLDLDRVSEALTEAQAAFDIDRKSVLARSARAMVYGRQGNVAESLKEFNQALKLNDKEIGTYLALSRYYLTLDSIKAAEVNLYRAQQVNDKDVRSYLGLGELYERQRIPDLAISQYESAKQIDPTDITVMSKVARLYFRTKRYNESVNEWLKVIKTDSTYAPAFYQAGNIYYLAEQYPKAVWYAERYTQMQPDDILGHWLLARSLTESGQFSKALPALERVAVNDSLKALSQLLLARSYFYNKEFAKSNEIFALGKNLSPYDLDIYGRSLVLSGDTTKGVEMLRSSLVNDTLRKAETKLETQRQIASFLYSQGKIVESADEFAAIATKKPSVDAYITTAQIYAFGKKYDLAEVYYGRAIQLDPASLKARLGLVLMYAGKSPGSDEMEKEANALIAAAVNSPDTLGIAYSWLGYSYLVSKKLDQSVDALSKGLNTIPKADPAFLNTTLMLAQAYHTRGDCKKAKEYYEQVLKIDKNNKPSKEGLDLLKKSNCK